MPTVEQGASKMSMQQRSLDAAGLRRMQDLDKSLFGGGSGRNRASSMFASTENSPSVPSAGHGVHHAPPWMLSGTGQLPPLINAWADNIGMVGGGGGPVLDPSQQPGGHMGGHPPAAGKPLLSHTHPLVPAPGMQWMYGTTERPRTVGNSAGGPGQRKAANAKLSRRGGAAPSGYGLDPLASGNNNNNISNISNNFLAASGGVNPWEALQEAAPATRYGGNTTRESGGLQLLMPTGSSRASMVSYESHLLSYLQPVSGPSGTAALVSAGVSPMRAPSRPLTSPSRPPTSPSRPPTSPRPASSPRRPGSSPRRPGSPQGMSANGAASSISQCLTTAQSTSADTLSFSVVASGGLGSSWAMAAGAPVAAGGPAAPGLHGPSLPPLVPRPTMHSALAVPAPGAEQPWGGAGLPFGMYGALAELRGGVTAGLAMTARETFQHGGMNSTTAAAVAAGVVDAQEESVSPPSLGHMISARPSNRRQVQLMADWLDNIIGQLWEQHIAMAKITAEGKGQEVATAAGPGGPGGGGGAMGSGLTNSVPASDGSTRAQGAAASAANGGGGGGGGTHRRAAAAAAAAAAAVPCGSKAALAMRFGNVAAGLKDLSSSLYHVATDTQLWSSMVEATAAVANAVVQNMAHRCWEEGALLARLWNLQTALMDSGLAAARKAKERLSATAAEQAAKIRRLDPLIDWELESRAAREEMSAALEASRAEALLAGRERDALLRENDKIIAHYRKELKTYRREQRRNAYRLARKLRNTQQQLELMTRDRDVLFNAVAYTKSQTAQLVDVISGLQVHVKTVMAVAMAGGNGKVSFEGEEVFPEVQQIEHGLKNILHSLQKVRDVTQDAEDSHFVTEEQVTAVAAADTTGDELVDEVLAEGDPEPSPEELEAEAEAAAALERQRRDGSDSDYDSDDPDPRSALSMMAEAALRGTGESSDEGEDSSERSGSEGSARQVADNGDDDDDEDEDGGMADGMAMVGQDDDAEGDGGGDDGRGLYPEISPAAVIDGEGVLEDGEEGGSGAARGQADEDPESHSANKLRSNTSSPGPTGRGDEEDEAAAGSRTPISRSASPELLATTLPRSTSSGIVTGSGEAGANTNANKQQDNKSNKKKNKNKNKNKGNGVGSARGIDGPGAGSVGPSGDAAGGHGSTRSTLAVSATQVGQAQDPAHAVHGVGGVSHGRHGNGAADGHGSLTGGGVGAMSMSRSASPTTPLPLRGRSFNVATNGCQTGPELLRGVADPEIAEGAKQMKTLREALGEIGIVGNPNDDADGTDGLLTALRQYMSSLSSEAGTLSQQLEKLKLVAESAEAAQADLSQTAEARGREVAAVRRELLEAKKRYTQLCNSLEALGIDPRNPTLPNQVEGEITGTQVDARVPGSRGSIKANRETTSEGKSSKGTKVSRLAAVKEKARERALSTTVPQAPVLGRTTTYGQRGGGNSGFTAPGNRVTLPAAMLAAAQQRAVEAAATGEGEGSGAGGGGGGGSGNVAATISAWRTPGGAGGAGGPTPVYIRPDRAAATARLQDALTRYSDAKPRTLEWLLKLIDSVYRGKATSDEQRSKIGQEPLTMIEYMFQHLSGQYGTKDLVNQYAAQLVATCLQYSSNDPRVGTFQRFLMEEWDTRALCAYIDATRRLQEPTRVPCCEFPADYLPAGAKKGESGPVDVRKALWVSERVLMRRSAKAAYVFAQLLASKAEPITTTELDSYFVAPGSYGSELQQVRQFELGRGEFKRISSAVFLDALCGEYARMENVFREVLPEMFSQYDSDGDGWITKQGIQELFNDMVGDMAHAGLQLPAEATSTTGISGGGAGGGGSNAASGGGAGGGINAANLTEADRETALEALWTVLSTAEADARNRADSSLVYPDGAVRPPGGGVVPPSAVTHLSDSGFFEGAFRSDFVRSWVRAFKTGAAQLPGGVGALAEMDLHTARDAARRLLSVLVARHWNHHGETLEGFFADAGTLAEQQLKQQAALLDGDMGGPHGDGRDGPRRAAALCTVLRLLLVKKADRFSSLLTADNLTGGPHNGPPAELEELLERLTAAVRLLYAPPDSIWVVGAEMDELESLGALEAADVGALPAGYKRWLGRVAVRCCALHDRLHLSLPQSPLIPHLQTHRGVPFHARMWRRAAAAAVAARRRAATISRTPPFAAMRNTTNTGSGAIPPGPTTAASPDRSPVAPASPVGKTPGVASPKRPASGSPTGLRSPSPVRPGSGSSITRPGARSPASRPGSAAPRPQQPYQRATSPQLSLPMSPSISSGALPPIAPSAASAPVPLSVTESDPAESAAPGADGPAAS